MKATWERMTEKERERAERIIRRIESEMLIGNWVKIRKVKSNVGENHRVAVRRRKMT